MGIKTTLAGITLTQADINAASALGADAPSFLNAVQNKTTDLIANLKQMVSVLPAGDANIATLNTIITTLS